MRYRNNALAVFLLIALTSIALLSIYLLRAPEVTPEDSAKNEFSASRAMHHVREIAKEPHAMGSTAHAQVRKYLLGSMLQLGLNPEIQETTVTRQAGGSMNAGYVYNIVGRLRGKGTGKAILLVAHYDSQPNSLGAGDDGAGVAAILETARALKEGEKLKHDVIFLLTDGEEYGLYGARAFMEHPWVKEVGLVMNVEGRGNEGPSMTFELSHENGWVAKEYSEAAPYPFISSLAYEIYSRMPNDSDFTIFKNAGYTGINSAFIDGFAHYHKATDSPENLNQNSLQHHGSNMLALTRHFGNISLQNTKAPNRVFFNLINGWVIQYSKEWNWLWFGLTALVFIAAIVIGKRREALSIRQVVAGFFLFLVLIALITGLFIPLNSFVTDLLLHAHSANIYGTNSFLIAYLILALGLFLLLSWLALRWIRLFSLIMGISLMFFGLTITLLLLAPAATYLFMFPLLFSLCGVLTVILLDLHRKENVCLEYACILLLTVVPAIFIMMPLVHVVFVAFGLQLPMGAIALFLLLLGLLLPLLVIIERSFSWRYLPLLGLVLLLVGSLQIARAVAAEAPTAERPLHSHVSYYLNTDTGKAFWVSANMTADNWNNQFFKEINIGDLQEMYPHARRNYLKSPAEALELEAPAVKVLLDSAVGEERILRLHLKSLRNAAHMEVVLQPKDSADFIALFLNGMRLSPEPVNTFRDPVYHIRYHGLPVSKDGILELHTKLKSPLKIALYDHTLSLPGQLVKIPKPDYVIAEQGDNSNVTIVKKTYIF